MKTRLAILICVGCFGIGDGMNAATDSLTPRWGHTVTELTDGRLLIAGGENESGLVAAIEIVDPVSPQSFALETVGTLSSPRRRHTAVLLDDGRVLVAGGEDSSGVLDSAELIDPATGVVSQVSLGTARADHTATLLTDGRVLLAGGQDGVTSLPSLQVFDPDTDTVAGGGDLAGPRSEHTATRLDDGRVLFVGGRDELGAIATTEFWTAGTVASGPDLRDARSGHTATRMRDGVVAVVGGSDGNAPLATVEVFWSELNAFVRAGSLAVPRAGHTAVVLPDNGHLMVLGGRSADGPVGAVEVMHPYQQAFVSQSPLDPARSEFAAAVAGPYVWVVGGRLSAGSALGSVSTVPFATLTADHASYPPNSTVTLRGSFWLPGEQVTVTIIQSDDDPTISVKSLADANGFFVNTDFSTGNDGSGFFIATAIGAQSGRTAALRFGGFIPPTLDGLSLSPSVITQTTDPVTISILGGFRVGVQAQNTYCKVRVVFCLATVYRSLVAGGHRVRVKGTRNDTDVDVWLDPSAVTTNRLDVVLPPSVTSHIDQYLVAVRQVTVYTETTTWIGFIPGEQELDRWDEVSGFFGPLTVLPPDSTPPLVFSSVAGSLGSPDWHTGDVSITWSVDDPESAISSTSGCSDVSVLADTAGTTFTCTATSRGGTTTESVTIKRDASPPEATLSVVGGRLGSNGWYVSPVIVRTTGSDSVSAPVTCTADRVQSADTTGVQVPGSCTNAANLTTAAAPILIKLDQTPPTITAAPTTTPNAAGWYQGDVTVTFTCIDALSGIASCPADQTLGSEGTSIASTPQVATDAAGHTSTPSNVVTVRIDRTPPVVALSGGPAQGGSYYFGSVPAAPECSGSDGLSGLDSCTISGYGATVGSHTVLATATDKAGHVSVQSATYTVLPWTFAGFYQPIEMGGVVNTVKGGTTVPIRFEAFAGPTELTDPAAIMQPLTATQALCGSAETNDIELQATGETSLRYDTASGQFIYNWKTPNMAGYCYVVTVTLKDATYRSAQFRLK